MEKTQTSELQNGFTEFISRLCHVDAVREEDYQIVTPLLDAILNAVSQTTERFIYVMDHHRDGIMYASEAPLFLGRYSPRDVKEKGFDFIPGRVPPDELLLLKESILAGQELVRERANNQLHVARSSHFHLSDGRGRVFLVNHQASPMCYDREGRIWLVLCTLSLSPYRDAGHIQLFENHELRYEYSAGEHEWKVATPTRLTPRQKEVLQYSAQGLDMKEIAQLTCTTLAAVKKLRRSLINKLEVTNITGAVSIARQQRMI